MIPPSFESSLTGDIAANMKRKESLGWCMIHNDGEKPQCRACSKTFSTVGSLRYHIRATHLGEMSFQCKSCGTRYRYGSSLQRHKQSCKAFKEEKKLFPP